MNETMTHDEFVKKAREELGTIFLPDFDVPASVSRWYLGKRIVTRGDTVILWEVCEKCGKKDGLDLLDRCVVCGEPA